MMRKVIFLYICLFSSKGISDITTPVEKNRQWISVPPTFVHVRVHHYSTHKEMDNDPLRSILSSFVHAVPTLKATLKEDPGLTVSM